MALPTISKFNIVVTGMVFFLLLAAVCVNDEDAKLALILAAMVIIIAALVANGIYCKYFQGDEASDTERHRLNIQQA